MTAQEYQAVVDQLVRHEGLRLFPYVDTVGKISVGVGRNLTDVGLSQGEAMALLDHDIERSLIDARSFAWFDGLDPIRQRVVLDMLFNLGLSRYRKFSATIAAIERGDYVKAAAQMLASKWATQVHGRAHTLAAMMKTGHS